MLEVKNVDIKISTRYIIKSLSLTLKKGDKLAIIGEEGNGKSTLLRSLLGICEYADITGTIDFKGNNVGYLEQNLNLEDLNKKVYDYLFKDEKDYFNKISLFYKKLQIMKLNDELLDRRMKSLSGGERIKTCLLKLLLEDCNILFLDEPTNDLDISTLEWLEKFINKPDMTIVFVSHDETLLSNTANMILHIEQIKRKSICRHTVMKTDYISYVQNRERNIEKETQLSINEKREYDKKKEKLNRILQKVEYQQNTISRSNPFGAQILKKKMHTLKYQEKKLDNTKLTEKPEVEESINFFFEDVYIPNKKIILNINLEELKILNKVLSKNLKLNIVGNSHICIIGKNGIGKSTLIKYIYKELKNRSDLIVGYMPQNYEDEFNSFTSVEEFLLTNSKIEKNKAQLLLACMNLTWEEMSGKITNLSNGTKAKLFLVKMVLNKCNVLILDEPTRNLSPLSNPVIRKVLKDFKGTIISVSHDRKYIKEVVDTIYKLDENGLTKIDEP